MTATTGLGQGFSHAESGMVRRASGPSGAPGNRRRGSRGLHQPLGSVEVKEVSRPSKAEQSSRSIFGNDSVEPISQLDRRHFTLFRERSGGADPGRPAHATRQGPRGGSPRGAPGRMSGKLGEDARRVSARGARLSCRRSGALTAFRCFAFDGSSELVPIGEFREGPKDPRPPSSSRS